jgi:hypothetical protein
MKNCFSWYIGKYKCFLKMELENLFFSKKSFISEKNRKGIDF